MTGWKYGSDMSREAHTSPGWIVVETVKGDERPNVVYEAGMMRPFIRIGRRLNFSSTAVTNTLVKAVDRVQTTTKRQSGRNDLPDGTPVEYHVLPILGPNDEVYGCQIWLGRRDDVVIQPRNVEAYSFDLQTGLTSHGPGVDENILSIDAVDTTSLGLSRR